MADIKYGRKVYRGVDKIAFRDADDPEKSVEFGTVKKLVTKNISASGTYDPVNDNADGYSLVTVSITQPKESDVNFYDYDGTLVASYTAADFINLTTMPENPSHTGLIAQGWNWTLADAKTYVAAYGALDIGQMYATSSGKTEYDVEINEATGMTATFSFSNAEKDWGDGTVNTNTSHTYATAGNYTIKLSGKNIPPLPNSKKIVAVRVANGVTSFSNSALAWCHFCQKVTLPSSISTIGQQAFLNCTSLRCVIVPINVSILLNPTFGQDAKQLKKIILPKAITDIGQGLQAPSIENIFVPVNQTQIQSNAITSYLAKKIIIPNTVTEIRGYAIRNSFLLLKLTLPNSINTIAANALYSLPNLTTITVRATTPPALGNVSAIPSNVTKIEIPRGSLAAYESETNWCEHAGKYVEVDFND